MNLVQGVRAHGWVDRIFLAFFATSGGVAMVFAFVGLFYPWTGGGSEAALLMGLCAMQLWIVRGLVLWRYWAYRAGMSFGWLGVGGAVLGLWGLKAIYMRFVVVLLALVWLNYLNERRADFIPDGSE